MKWRQYSLLFCASLMVKKFINIILNEADVVNGEVKKLEASRTVGEGPCGVSRN